MNIHNFYLFIFIVIMSSCKSYSDKKLEGEKTIKDHSYLIDINIMNSFSGYRKQILLNNRDESSPLFHYPNTKTFMIYFINYNNRIDRNGISISSNDTISIKISKERSDSIFNLAADFINNYKITNTVTLINGTNKNHDHETDGSHVTVMVNCNDRTLVAIIESVATSEHKTKEFNNLYNYFLNLEKKSSPAASGL